LDCIGLSCTTSTSKQHITSSWVWSVEHINLRTLVSALNIWTWPVTGRSYEAHLLTDLIAPTAWLTVHHKCIPLVSIWTTQSPANAQLRITMFLITLWKPNSKHGCIVIEVIWFLELTQINIIRLFILALRCNTTDHNCPSQVQLWLVGVHSLPSSHAVWEVCPLWGLSSGWTHCVDLLYSVAGCQLWEMSCCVDLPPRAGSSYIVRDILLGKIGRTCCRHCCLVLCCKIKASFVSVVAVR